MKANPHFSQVIAEPRFAAIKCVIIYEDSEAGKAGRRFCERLAAVAGRDCASCCEIWNFRVLGIRSVRNEAASAAMAADIVVFALANATQFPPEVKEWIDFWLWLDERTRPAVVALSTGVDAQNKGPILHLQSAARRKGLPFFSHIATGPCAPPPLRGRRCANSMRETARVPSVA